VLCLRANSNKALRFAYFVASYSLGKT